MAWVAHVVLDSRWILYIAGAVAILTVCLVFTVVKKTWEGISAALVLISALSWFAYCGLADYWVFNRPAAPVPQKGQVVEREQHGSFYYISQDEESLSACLSDLALVGLLAGVGSLAVSEIRCRRSPSKM